jgi:gas vesicle protein
MLITMRNKNNMVITFAAGALAGLITGLLVAPTKGKNARNLITYRVKKYGNKISELVYNLLENHIETVNKAKQAGKMVINTTKNKAKDLLRNIDELTSNIEDFNYNN